MKCPLRFTLDYSEKGILSTPAKDCLKEECAWWDEEMAQCSINGLEPTLQHIALSLRDIAKELTLRKK